MAPLRRIDLFIIEGGFPVDTRRAFASSAVLLEFTGQPLHDPDIFEESARSLEMPTVGRPFHVAFQVVDHIARFAGKEFASCFFLFQVLRSRCCLQTWGDTGPEFRAQASCSRFDDEQRKLIRQMSCRFLAAIAKQEVSIEDLDRSAQLTGS
jgi:hypothetical protein